MNKINTKDQEPKMAYIEAAPLNVDDENITMVDVFHKAVGLNCNEKITYYNAEGDMSQYTYSELEIISRKILTNMRSKGLKRGDKVIFQFSTGKDFVEVFWASMFGGFIPVPLNYMTSPNENLNEAKLLKNIWNLLGESKIIISEDGYKDYIKTCTELGIGEEYLISVAELKAESELGEVTALESDEMAIIFFTSGSTGMPKGVVQTNRAIVMREIGVIQLNNLKKEVNLNWMPLEHPGGVLMAHFRAIMLGSEIIQVDKEYILENPIKWLDLLDQYRVGYSWAPHFAYVLINEELEKKNDYSWDLSSVTMLLNGGEMVNEQGARRFLELLQKYHLSEKAMVPSWGMAETCSGVLYNKEFTLDKRSGIQTIKKVSNSSSVIFSELDKDAINITEIGVPIPGISIRIVDSNNVILPEANLGRFQLKGYSVTKEYYKNPYVNGVSFTKDGWLITGDLGFIYDGKMTMTGREKDIIIINGLNYNNVEIETVIEDNTAVVKTFTAVCTVRDDTCSTDKIALFFVPQSKEKILDLCSSIRECANKRMRLKIDYLIPLKEDDIPKTNLGKIQRAKLGQCFMNGKFNNVLMMLEEKINLNKVTDWIYKEKFIEQELGEKEVQTHKNILVFCDDNLQCKNLVEEISSSGNRVIKVKNTMGDTSFVNDYISVDFSNYDKVSCLADEFNKNNIDTILYCSSFVREPSSTQDLIYDQQCFFRGFFHVCKTIVNKINSVNKIVIVTNKLVQVENEHPNYTMGNIVGLFKCFAEECTQLKCFHIDVDDITNIDNITQMINTILGNNMKQQEIILRNGKKFILKLEKVNNSTQEIQKEGFVKNGCYVITGGLGGIGFELAKYLIQRYDSSIILFGRSKVTEDNNKSAKLEILKKLTENVVYYSCEVDDEENMEKFIKDAEDMFSRSINGIFHSAGLGNLEEHWKNVEDRLIKNMSFDLMEKMNKAKIYGSFALYNIAKKRKDVVLNLFSSTNSFWGSVSFAAYSSANSFVNYFAGYLKAEGLVKVKCLNFSSWRNLGMSQNVDFGVISNKKGFCEMEIKQGLLSIDFANRLEPYRLFIGLDSKKDTIAKYINKTDECKIVSQIEIDDVKEEAVLTMTEEKLSAIWRELLNVRAKQNDDFFELGGKSITAMKLVSRIRDEFKVRITIKHVFSACTLMEMAKFIENSVDESRNIL